MTAPLPSPRTGRAAVAAGVLLFVSVAAELLRPVQTAGGSLTDVAGFVVYLAAWTLGAGCLVVALSGLGTATVSRAAQVGRWISLAGAVLFTAFGAVALGTAVLTGAPAEESFLLFAVGLLLLLVGAVPLALGLRSTLPGWWIAMLVAGGAAAVALLVEPDPWHDLGLFLFDGACIALGLGLLSRAPQTAAPRRPERSTV